MDGEQLNRLTQGQRECLRLVLAHKSSKQIAIELGKSRFTIDKRIERAIQTLGVTNRTEAALLLARHESSPAYERFACEPERLAGPAAPSIMAPSQPVEGSHGGRVRDSVVDVQVPEDWLAPRRRPWFQWPLPSRGGQRYDLTTRERLIWIGLGTLTTIIVLFLFLASAESLQRTLWGLASRNS